MKDAPAATILITGVGDTVGQALVKAARQSSLMLRIIGTDADARAVGLPWVDRNSILPHCAEAEPYLEAMAELCAAEKVQLVLPGSEKELEVLSREAERLRRQTGAIVVASAPEVLRIGMDKWETCRFLERAGLRYPFYARASSREELARLVARVGFPLIAKPRRGTGARGIRMIHSGKDMEFLAADDIVQEYLEPAEEEYSVAVYTLKNGRQAGAIAYRREQLVAGDTFKAVVRPNETIEEEACAVAAALGAAGPCNVQLRLTVRGPVTFEINPRFSGGASMRAHFGYNEVEMAVHDLVIQHAVPLPRIKTGYVRRFWEECYAQ